MRMPNRECALGWTSKANQGRLPAREGRIVLAFETPVSQIIPASSRPIPNERPAASPPTTSISTTGPGPVDERHEGAESPEREQRHERRADRNREPVLHRGEGEGHEGNGSRHHERQERSQAVSSRERLTHRFAPELVDGLVRADREEVAGPHREAVGEEVRDAEDQRGAGVEPGARDARDDREGGDESIVGPVDQIPEIVPHEVAAPRRLVGRADRLHIRRGGATHFRATRLPSPRDTRGARAPFRGSSGCRGPPKR